MTILERGLLVAERGHANQHYGIYPYIYHIRSTVDVAIKLGYDEIIQVCCALHDIFEDTGISYNDIKVNFGEEIADIVYAVTDELGKNRNERKSKTYPKIASIKKAIIVKLCDRYANIEQSLLEGSRMLYVYKNEDAELKEALGYIAETDPLVVRAWDALNKLMDYPKIKDL